MNNARFKSCPRFSMRVIATRSKRLLILVERNKRVSRKWCGQPPVLRHDLTLKGPYGRQVAADRHLTRQLTVRPAGQLSPDVNDNEDNSHYEHRRCRSPSKPTKQINDPSGHAVASEAMG